MLVEYKESITGTVVASPIVLTYKSLVDPPWFTIRLYTPVEYLYLHLHSPDLHAFGPVTHIFSQKKIVQGIGPNIVV